MIRQLLDCAALPAPAGMISGWVYAIGPTSTTANHHYRSLQILDDTLFLRLRSFVPFGNVITKEDVVEKKRKILQGKDQLKTIDKRVIKLCTLLCSCHNQGIN